MIPEKERHQTKQNKVYLNCHATPLAQIWLHSMDRVPKQSNTTPSPGEDGCPVIYVTSKNGFVICSKHQIYHIITPTLKYFQQPFLYTCQIGIEMNQRKLKITEYEGASYFQYLSPFQPLDSGINFFLILNASFSIMTILLQIMYFQKSWKIDINSYFTSP